MSHRKSNNQYTKHIRQRILDPIEGQMAQDQYIEKNQLVDAAELYLCSTEAGERERELLLRNSIDAANAKRKTSKVKAVVELNPNWTPKKNFGGRFGHKFRKQIKET